MANTQFELFTGLEARYIDPEQIQWPGDSIVLYALEDNQIVGRMGIIQLPHIEGTWLREDKRKSTLGMRLITKIEGIMEEEKRTAIFSFVYNNQPEIADYMQRLGYTELPLKVYMKPLVDKESEIT